MNSNFYDDLDWFISNINNLIHDFEFEKQKVFIDYYFDYADVRNAVLGMDAFYSFPFGFDFKLFNKNYTLVQCLASSGWIDEIKMLPPHQAEFLTMLNLDDYDYLYDKDVNKKINDFFQEISVYSEIIEKKIRLDKMRDDEISAFVKNQAGKADKFFKAIQSARHLDWKGRLAHLRTFKILKLSPSSYKYDEIVKSDRFHKLKYTFDYERPKLTINNFADSVAIAILIELIDGFNRNESNKIPIFFDSRGLFQEVVKKARLEEFLKYKNLDGTFSNIFRDSDYFIFKCSFRSSKYFPPKKRKQYQWKLEDIYKLREELLGIQKTRRSLSSKMFTDRAFYGKPIPILIKEIRKFSFLGNVWLRYLAEEDVRQIAHEIAKAAEDKRVHFSAETVVKETKYALERNVIEYNWLFSLWTKLEKASESLTGRKEADDTAPLCVSGKHA